MADNWMFDGQGIELSDLVRLEQLKNQEKQLEELRRIGKGPRPEPPSQYGKCPYCGGDLPGKYELCKSCRSTLYWTGTKAFKTAAEAYTFATEERKKQDLLQKQQNDMAEAYRAKYPGMVSEWRWQTAGVWCLQIACITPVLFPGLFLVDESKRTNSSMDPLTLQVIMVLVSLTVACCLFFLTISYPSKP